MRHPDRPETAIAPLDSGSLSACSTLFQIERGSDMPSRSLQKQISIFLPLEDWKRVRLEAARRNVPITELCRRWMSPDCRSFAGRPPEQGFHQPVRARSALSGRVAESLRPGLLRPPVPDVTTLSNRCDPRQSDFGPRLTIEVVRSRITGSSGHGSPASLRHCRRRSLESKTRRKRACRWPS